MKHLSISFSNDVIEESNQAAKKLGISRSEFIRQATTHELKLFKRKLEEEEIIKSFNAMKQSSEYLKMSQKLQDEFTDELPEEKGAWWIKR